MYACSQKPRNTWETIKTGERETDPNTYSQQLLEQLGRMFIEKQKMNCVNQDPTDT